MHAHTQVGSSSGGGVTGGNIGGSERSSLMYQMNSQASQVLYIPDYYWFACAHTCTCRTHIQREIEKWRGREGEKESEREVERETESGEEGGKIEKEKERKWE